MEKPTYNKKHSLKFQPKKKVETTDNDATKETTVPEEKPVVQAEKIAETKKESKEIAKEETPKKVVKNLLRDEPEAKATEEKSATEAKEGTKEATSKKVVKNLLRDEPEAKATEEKPTTEAKEVTKEATPKKVVKNLLRDEPEAKTTEEKPATEAKEVTKGATSKKVVKNLLQDEPGAKATEEKPATEAKEVTKEATPKKVVKNLLRDEPEAKATEEKPATGAKEVTKEATPKKVVKNLLRDEPEAKATETKAKETTDTKEAKAPKKLVRNLLRDEPEAETTNEPVEKSIDIVPPKKELKRTVLRSKPSASERPAAPRPRIEKTLKFVPKKRFNESDRRDSFERPAPRADRELKFIPKQKNASAFDKFKAKDKKSDAPKPDKQPQKDPTAVGTRLNKYLAHSGLGTRRQTSQMVFDGKVKVNGEVMLNPAYAVQEGDLVETENKTMKPKSKKVYILLNKPKNATTEEVDADSEQRTAKTIVATKHKEKLEQFEEMGINVTGLLVLTNDAPLLEKFQNPEQKVKRVFHLKLDRIVSVEDLKAVEQKLEPTTGPIKSQSVSHVVGAELDEVGINLMLGNIASIQAAFDELGYGIKKLDCTYYAGLTKKDLPRGWFRELNKQEAIMLKHFI